MKEETVLGKTYFLYFVILSMLVLFRILASVGTFSFLGGAADYIFTFVVQILVLFGISVFGFSRLTGKSKKMVLNEYNFQKISKKSIFLCVLMGIIVYFLNSYIASFFYYLMSLFGYSGAGAVAIADTYPIWLLLINIVFTAVLPAVCEETVHRGMLLSQIKKQNVWKAVLISSLLFGLLHINIYQFFYATILGVLLAILTLSTKSIYPAMIVHFMNNAINVYMTFASANNLFSVKAVSFIYALGAGNNFLSVLFLLLFFAFLVLCLYVLYIELCKETARKSISKLQEGLGRFLARKIYFEELSDVKNNIPLKGEKEIELSVIKDYIEKNSDEAVVNVPEKGDFKSKLFFFGILAIGVVCTIFTFVWGII